MDLIQPKIFQSRKVDLIQNTGCYNNRILTALNCKKVWSKEFKFKFSQKIIKLTGRKELGTLIGKLVI